MEPMTMRADLHVHSKYSKRPSEWILRKIGCSESYTDPHRLYRTARERGMHFVTITDHNTLSGSLEIAHLEGTFVSEEITTYFPEDRCKLHVLAYDLTEVQHADISRLRENVYDLVAYLDKAGILHALAHPLYAVNDRLSLETIEKLMLLFTHFEINGSRDRHQNDSVKAIVEKIGKMDMERLANKTGIKPIGREPWKKVLIGGSDDHSSLTIARTYSEVTGAWSKEIFLDSIRMGNITVVERVSTPKTMGHNLYSIGYQYYGSRFNLHKAVSHEPFLRFTDHVLTPKRDRSEDGFLQRLKQAAWNLRRPGARMISGTTRLQDLLLKEAREVIFEDRVLKQVLEGDVIHLEQMDEVWFSFVNQISEKVIKKLADSIFDNLSGANVIDIFQMIGSAGSLYTLLAPYFVSYSLFTKDREFARLCQSDLFEHRKKDRQRLKIAHFTDTFYEVNGVALTLQMQLQMALKNHKQQTIITCDLRPDASGVVNFAPIGVYEMPEYPELKLYYPPLLKMLNACFEQGFTHIHSATPGPVGLAALVIARILRLPFHGTYHTALPQYVMHLTEDNAMEDLMWRYMIWYYNQMEAIYVPSKATGEELAAHGIPREKLRLYDRGIDIERFHPSKRNGFFKKRLGLTADTIKLLYVGRVSREKNLPFLVEVFKRVAAQREDAHLVVVGDGPYLPEMRRALAGFNASFTGYLEGEDLEQAYASSDVFLFPSTTDTFGNVVLEAQASGLPVIVTDSGGPQENVIPGETGYVVPAGDCTTFVHAILGIVNDRTKLETMRAKARAYMKNRSFESAYLDQWNSYRN